MEEKKKADLSPEEIIKFRKIEKSFLDHCRQFGYQEIKTASIEPLHLFTATDALSSDELKRVYSFLDWGGWSGERVVLRPDLTISTVRYYLDNYQKEKPRVKLCYIENYFSLDETGREVSEKWQFGLENIGEGSSSADVEVIFIARDTLKDAGFEKISLHLSYPAIIIECIKLASDNDEKQQEIRKLIKDEKFEEIKSDNPNIDNLIKRLLRLKGNNVSYLHNLKSEFHNFVKIQELLDRFKKVCLLLDELKCDYEINFSLSKDLEYYTGIQFQIFAVPHKKEDEKLCSGGRYDDLISRLGNQGDQIPSVGFALYINNLINFLPISRDVAQNIGIIVKNIASQNIRMGQNLHNRFNQLGFISYISLTEIESARYDEFGLILEVDHEKFKDGYYIIYSHQIDKPLLKSLLGEFFSNG
jgi:histidyl-tRNA synthetase